MSFAGISGNNNNATAYLSARPVEPVQLRNVPTTEAEIQLGKLPPGGFSTMASIRFRFTPNTENEKIALNEAMAGGTGSRLTPILGAGTNKPLNDPRLTGYDITKYEYNRRFFASDGRTILESVTIHYLQNNKTG